MPATNRYRFFLLRYVPDLVNDEFVNFGLVLLSGEDSAGVQPAGGAPVARLKFSSDWRRLKCLDPDIDVEMLEALERELGSRLDHLTDREALLHTLHDNFSSTLQLSETKVSQGESPEKEIEALAKMYLESPARGKASREVAERQNIYRSMRKAFQEHNVWQSDLLWKRIPAATYTYKGDPLKIDCGYKPNGVVKLFQAVALKSDINAAKILAFSYPQMKEGIKKHAKADSVLTAIVDDDLKDDDDRIAFALWTLTQNNIQIAHVTDLNAIAEKAREELRL